MRRQLMAGLIWLMPSFGTSVVYDDNVFHRPAAEGDLSVRFSPRLDVLRRTQRLTVSGRFELDADRFAVHRALTTAQGREAASVDARYAASRRWSLAGAAAFTATETPSDLNELTALTPGRARARRVMVHPSATYDLRPGAGVTVGYLVTADTLNGGVSVTTHTASASIERHVSARQDVRVEYLEQRFLFGGGQASASRAVTGEWTRQLDRDTSLILRAGPRVTAGVLAPELAFTARHALRTTSLSLSYQQTQTTLIGLAGIARMKSVTAGIERELGSRMTLHALSAVVDTRQLELPSVTYRVSGGCAWKLTPRLGIEAAYDSDLQHGNLYAGQTMQNIRRNLVTLKAVIADAAARSADR